MISRKIFRITLGIFLYSLFCQLEISAQQYWSRLQSPVNHELRDCFFINRSTGWISGDSGTILKTTSGGSEWLIQNSGVFSNIEEIFFIDASSGWALTWEPFPDSTTFPGTIILKTSNGGANWLKSMFPDTNNFMSTIFFQNASTGFIGGVPSRILRTTNGGLNWVNTFMDTNVVFILPIFKINFFDDMTGYACSGFRDIAGVMWTTTDGGFNWNGEVLAPEPFFDIDIQSSNKAIASGGDLEYGSSIALTTNTGANWYYDTLGVFGLSTGISFRTKQEGWMTGSYSQKFLFSIDSGFTWNSVYTLDSSAMFDITFADTTIGYACGELGTILKYDRSSSSVHNTNGTEAWTFRLHQNFPNPFNPNTIIKYELAVDAIVTLEIYDITGTEILKSGPQYLRKGLYEFELNGSHLPSGIYFCQLSSGIYKVSNKMILLK